MIHPVANDATMLRLIPLITLTIDETRWNGKAYLINAYEWINGLIFFLGSERTNPIYYTYSW